MLEKKNPKRMVITMKKALTLLTIVIMTAFALVSCEGLFGGGSTDTPKAETKKFTQIVLESEGLDILSVRSKIFDKVGMIGTVPDSEPAAKYEIVFGDTNRPVTAAAKAELERYLATKSDIDVGYIVYSDGNSIAVYWQDARLMSLALVAFEKDYLGGSSLYPEASTIAKGGYTTKELEQEIYWIAIKEQAPEDLYNALKRLNSFYEGSKMCEWMANLWDGKYGGFYYSNSARDNEPFRPDLESTNQLTSWLQANGAMTSVNDQFPNELKIQIVDFAKSMQCAEDGYFYHPQWPQGTDKLNTDRYGRDLSWGVAIINRFYCDRDGDGVAEKQYPYYCTPSGAKCEEHYGKEGESCSYASATSSGTGLSTAVATASSSITASVQSSVGSAVSRIPSSTVTATATNKPDYSSSEAFTAWLEDYCSSIKTNSGAAHNINALQSEIIAKGFCDELLDFLEKYQQEVWEEQTSAGQTPTGLWQYEPDYRFVWGILKYMPFFNDSKYGRPIAHPEEIVNACMEVIMLPATGNYAMNDLMNQWSSITGILTNVQDKHKDPEMVAKIRSNLLERGAELIENSIEKLSDFKLEDGTFVYTYAGKSLATIYGVPISLGVREGDVNGNSLCSSYYRGMFTTLGFDAVPLCTSADGENFLKTIAELEPVEKTPLPEAKDLNFEDSTDVSSYGNITLDKRTGDGFIEIHDDPYGDYGNSLYFKSGKASDFGDYLRFTPTGNGGNCNIVEFDFLHVSTSEDNSALYQIKCGDSFMFTLGVKSNKLIIGTITSTGAGSVSEQLVKTTDNIIAEEWHRIRFEMYDLEDGSGDGVAKIFIDDELMYVSENFYGSHSATAVYNSNFAVFQIYSRLHYITECYLDNIYINTETKMFDENSSDISDARDN